jgi:hypothetical protein
LPFRTRIGTGWRGRPNSSWRAAAAQAGSSSNVTASAETCRVSFIRPSAMSAETRWIDPGSS